jgi:FixJ family two-component response regulator
MTIAVASARSSENPMPATPTVFVVDDDVSVREALESLIQVEGYEPRVFPSMRRAARCRAASSSM